MTLLAGGSPGPYEDLPDVVLTENSRIWSEYSSINDSVNGKSCFLLGNFADNMTFNSFGDNESNYIYRLIKHIKGIPNLKSFNGSYNESSNNLPSIIKGSLSYSYIIDGLKPVRVIRLNNLFRKYYYDDSRKFFNKKSSYIDIHRKGLYKWLKYQLYEARKNNEIIVVNTYNPEYLGELLSLLDLYKVKLRFVDNHVPGVAGKSKFNNFYYPATNYETGNFFVSYECPEYNRMKISVYGLDLVDTVKLEKIEHLNSVQRPSFEIYLLNNGAYEAFYSLSYTTKDGVEKNLNNYKDIVLYARQGKGFYISEGSSNVRLEFGPNVWVGKVKNLFIRNDLSSSAFFNIYGTTLFPGWYSFEVQK